MGDDNLTWKLTKTGVFDVRSYYKLLSSPLIDEFPWECIWCAKVPKPVFSSYGQQLMMGYSSLIILLSEVNPWLIGVAYVVVVMENLWTIFYSTLSLLMLYGEKFFRCLGSNG